MKVAVCREIGQARKEILEFRDSEHPPDNTTWMDEYIRQVEEHNKRVADTLKES